LGIVEIDLVTGRTTRVEMNDVRNDEPEPQLQALVERVNEQIQALQVPIKIRSLQRGYE
jgi:hypothetical protein